MKKLNDHQVLWIQLLQEPDIAQYGDRIISFAPGEGNRPLGSLFIDKDSEFLSFPTIYWEKGRADNNERLVDSISGRFRTNSFFTRLS